MSAIRPTDSLKDLVGDTRIFTASITGATNEGPATWVAGGNFPSAAFRVVSMTVSRSSSSAPFPTAFGWKDGTKAVGGFTVECDGQPGTGHTWTFEGLAVLN